MPLYACSKCGTVDNTALGDYWAQQLDAKRRGVEFKPLCTECLTGVWHREFPKRTAEEAGYATDERGFLR
jgi:hypothetical protein